MADPQVNDRVSLESCQNFLLSKLYFGKYAPDIIVEQNADQKKDKVTYGNIKTVDGRVAMLQFCKSSQADIGRPIIVIKQVKNAKFYVNTKIVIDDTDNMKWETQKTDATNEVLEPFKYENEGTPSGKAQANDWIIKRIYPSTEAYASAHRPSAEVTDEGLKYTTYNTATKQTENVKVPGTVTKMGNYTDEAGNPAMDIFVEDGKKVTIVTLIKKSDDEVTLKSRTEPKKYDETIIKGQTYQFNIQDYSYLKGGKAKEEKKDIKSKGTPKKAKDKKTGSLDLIDPNITPQRVSNKSQDFSEVIQPRTRIRA